MYLNDMTFTNNYRNKTSVSFGKGKNLLPKSEIKKIEEFAKQFDYSKTKSIQWKMKRAMDLGLSLLGSVVAAPIVLLSAAAIRLESKGPALFKQSRVGKNGKEFTIYKLRTMYSENSSLKNVNSANDDRITKVGRFLRKYSIDELPQFINIIKGDMSLVGPRPITIQDHVKRNITPDYVMRYTVKPGACLDYKAIRFDENPKIGNVTEQDYIKNWSLKKDFKNYFKIFSKVIKGSNY